MKKNAISMFHTGKAHVDNFDKLVFDLDEKIKLNHYVDESILKDAIELGYVSDASKLKIFEIWQELNAESEVLINSCSTLGYLVEEFNQKFDANMLRIDQAMAEEVAEKGTHIVVVTTLLCTLFTSHDLVYRLAHKNDPKTYVSAYLIAGAFDHYLKGDFDAYKEAVKEGVKIAARDCDAVVLAMASMAPALDDLKLDADIYISPFSGAQRAIDEYYARIEHKYT